MTIDEREAKRRTDLSQVTPGRKLDRSHISPVTTREELIYLLSRAAELELDPLLWNPETFGLAHHLLVSNRTEIAE